MQVESKRISEDRSVPDGKAQNPILRVSGLGHEYEVEGKRSEILCDVSFTVEKGAFVSIVGRSGSGKTTLLRCLSGLMQSASGTVELNGQRVTSPPPHLGFVFQDYSRSLLPWMTAYRNVELPLIAAGVAASDRAERVCVALEAVGLLHSKDHYPWQLSGGMQQRVAIARALACRPLLLIMDEPFASLDAQTKLDLEDLVSSLGIKLSVTTLLVTHDIDEAVYLSDRVIVLTGRPARVDEVIQIDLPHPRNQITTKQTPAFATLRSKVYKLIMSETAGGTATKGSSKDG